MPKKKIILVCGNFGKSREFISDAAKDSSVKWVFFGTDIFQEQSAANVLTGCEQIHIGSRLQQTAKELHKSFIDYVGELTQLRKSECWWLTTLSERSPTSSHLFLRICYLKIALDLSREVQQTLIIICDSRVLAKSIKENLASSSLYEIMLYDTKTDFLKKHLKNVSSAVFEKIWFLTRYSGRVAFARASYHKRLRKTVTSEETIVIHSWVDDRSFSKTGAYQDIYFGDLGKCLMQKGSNVIYLLDILPTTWYPKSIDAAGKSQIEYLLMEDFVSFSDIIRSIHVVWGLPTQITGFPLFGDIDIRSIVAEELKNERSTSIGEHAFLCYHICKKLSQTMIIKNFIFTYENQACQKMFVQALHEYSPKTTCVGYVHTYAIPMYTLYSIAGVEKNIMPLPDRIIVNGEQSKKNLIDCGYPSSIISLGGALRYTYLWTKHDSSICSGKRHNILVATSVNIIEAVELIKKAFAAFANIPNYTIIIKMHPTLPYRKIAGFFQDLPNNVCVSDLSVQELLKTAELVLYTSSTVAIEAVGMRIPVIHVKSDHIIDMNFFEGDDEIPSFSDPQDIAHFGKQILANKERLPLTVSDRLVSKFFLPVNDTVFSLFARSK